MNRSLARSYLAVTVILLGFVAFLRFVTRGPAGAVTESAALLPPMLVLVALTFLVLLIGAAVRNAAVIRGTASMDFYRTYGDARPPEWIERPAKTYDNLLQLPTLFYVACLTMMALSAIDSIQVTLLWVFVATRIAHAIVYIGFNVVAYRFAMFILGVITLAVIWWRLAALAAVA